MYNKEIKLGKGLVAYSYKYFIDKEHPLASKPDGIVLYHRHVFSLKIGRWILGSEEVHHVDENPLNNDPDNLEILSKSEHARLHRNTQYFTKPCKYCNKDVSYTVCSKLSVTYCSDNCKHKDSIKDKSLTKEILNELIPKYSWTALGEMFGYTDNGIKKRAKVLGCDITKGKFSHKR